MLSSDTGLSVKDEKKYVGILFFLFAVQIMSWVPRFPEVKANLGLSNGEFGTYLSLGSIGAVAAMLTSGHLVHKFGARKVLLLSTFSLCLAISVIVHLQSAPIFILVNIVNGASVSAFNTALNAQAFHAQDRAGEMILSRQHGYWTVGAVITAIISGFMIEFVGIALHINVLSTILFFSILYIIKKLGPELITPSPEDENDFGVKDLFTSFRIDYLVSAALVCGIMIEFATADWSAIYTKETIGVRGSLATVPYILTFTAMIIGRLGQHRLTPYIPLQRLVQIGSLVGGIGFIGFITASSLLVDYSKTLAYVCALIGFTIGGFCSAILSPTFFTAANKRSPQPSAVVVGQMGVINAILVLCVKTLIAWTAQLTGSIAIALIIPGLMLISVAFMSRVTKDI
ncbi:MAG: MFS transporter [Candidatus Planktophila sp.]